MSSVQVTVLETVEVLPQASLAMKVLVCDLLHAPITEPVFAVTVGAPHASVALAVPNAVVIADDTGLHPNGTFT
jgi:hypothetical protein